MVHIPRWQIGLILFLLLAGLVFAAPNLFDRQTTEDLPGWLPSKQINLGLDLRGGSYLLLEAELESVVEEHLENLADSLRRELRRAKLDHSAIKVQGQTLRLTLSDPNARDQLRTIVGQLSTQFQVTTSDDGKVDLVFTDLALAELRSNIMEQAIEIVRIRLDETGTREPTIQRQGERRILVQLPGVDDPERIKEILGQTAKLTFRFVLRNIDPSRDPIPRGAEVLPSKEGELGGGPASYAVKKRVMVSGENLVDAQATFQDNQPVVSFRFDSVGAKRFADATQKNVGELFAIVLDDEIISAPVIREPILGGSGIISGSFTVQEVQDLALLLRAGALPAPLVILEERTVGPGLGADSIRAGEIASLLGLVFVIIFMAACYGIFGVVANIALVANLVLLAAALSALQATLTLPGIAGIVLTIGMAVDANVLIFERIREEMRVGRGPVMAIDVGYQRAITTILDSNLTTLIAAVLLFYFGSGPVKGFAVTLSLGIMTSMFTAIMVTRLLLVTWLRRARPQTLPI